MKIIGFVSQYLVVARTGPYVGSSNLPAIVFPPEAGWQAGLDPYIFQQSRYETVEEVPVGTPLAFGSEAQARRVGVREIRPHDYGVFSDEPKKPHSAAFFFFKARERLSDKLKESNRPFATGGVAMAKRKRSLLLRIWYSMVVVPIIMFFVFAQGVNRTIGNPEYYQQQIRQRRLGEVLSSQVPEVLGKSLPLAQNAKFDPQWTEDTLSSLIKGTLDYLNGKTREPHFPVDLGPVYNQLPEPIRSGQLPMPGLAQFAALAKAGKVDLVSQYRDSKLVQQLLKLEKYITIGKMVEYILAAVVIATILLTLLLIKEKRRILALLGGPLMAQGLVLAVFLWVSHRIYLLPGAGKVLERYGSSWTLPFVQVGVDIFFNFIKLITALSVYIAATGAVMLLAEWALRSAASRPRVSSRESGVGSVKELPV